MLLHAKGTIWTWLCSSCKFTLTWRRSLELSEAVSEKSGPSCVVGSPPSTSTKPVGFSYWSLYLYSRSAKSFTSWLIPGVLLRITQTGHIRGLRVHYIWMGHQQALTYRNCLHLPVLNILVYHVEAHRSRNNGKCCERNSRVRSGSVCRLYCLLSSLTLAGHSAWCVSTPCKTPCKAVPGEKLGEVPCKPLLFSLIWSGQIKTQPLLTLSR